MNFAAGGGTGQHDEGDEGEPADPFDGVEEVGDLGDLRGLARRLFNIWWDSAELRWAAYAWHVLTGAGLTTWTDEVSRTIIVCRLVALAGVGRDFAARAFAEGEVGEWTEHVVGVSFEGDYPLLDRLAISRVADRPGVRGSDPGDDWSVSAARLVVGLAQQEWPVVTKALADALGDDGLFAALRMMANAEARYPLPDEVVRDATSIDVSDKVGAYLWIVDGLPQ